MLRTSILLPDGHATGRMDTTQNQASLIATEYVAMSEANGNHGRILELDGVIYSHFEHTQTRYIWLPEVEKAIGE